MKLFGYKCKCSYLATQVFCKNFCQSPKIGGGGWAWSVRFVRMLKLERSFVTITANVWLFAVAGIGGFKNGAQRNVKADLL